MSPKLKIVASVWASHVVAPCKYCDIASSKNSVSASFSMNFHLQMFSKAQYIKQPIYFHKCIYLSGICMHGMHAQKHMKLTQGTRSEGRGRGIYTMSRAWTTFENIVGASDHSTAAGASSVQYLCMPYMGELCCINTFKVVSKKSHSS